MSRPCLETILKKVIPSSRTFISTQRFSRRSCQLPQWSYIRQLSTEALASGEATIDSTHTPPPRWLATPPRMKAPFRSKTPVDNDFPVNEDPEKLNRAYVKALGADGDKLLTEDVKWLAVTHKSFDHGRRGFNDRLAYLGRKIVNLQLSLALVEGSKPRRGLKKADDFGRIPPDQEVLGGAQNLSAMQNGQYLMHSRLGALAKKYGMVDVTRWKPRMASNLKESGIDQVTAQTLYAIIGALALQQGGEVATRMTKERLLVPLKVKSVA